jgi:hypothetical protein
LHRAVSMRLLLVASLIAACAPAPQSAPERSTAAPEPKIATVRISGHVTQPGSTTPAEHALITVAVSCSTEKETPQDFADPHGNYEISIAVPAVSCAATVHAFHGGARGSIEVSTERDTRADITLNPIPSMTRSAGEALIQSFVRLVNGDPKEQQELATYVWGGLDALQSAVEDYRAMLGPNVTATITNAELSARDQRVDALLRGARGKELSLGIYQDRVGRFVSPLVHYSHRSRMFLAWFSRFVSSGDAEKLARLLTADDIDYPVDRAKRVIEKYRPRFQPAGGRHELVSVDEKRSRLTYRLTWHRDGETATTTVVLGYGDGLLWLADDDV